MPLLPYPGTGWPVGLRASLANAACPDQVGHPLNLPGQALEGICAERPSSRRLLAEQRPLEGRGTEVMTPADLLSLASRLEMASGPDRALFRELYDLLFPDDGSPERSRRAFEAGFRWYQLEAYEQMARALFAEKLPGYRGILVLSGSGCSRAAMLRDGCAWNAEAATPALALAAALCRALAAQEGGN